MRRNEDYETRVMGTQDSQIRTRIRAESRDISVGCGIAAQAQNLAWI